MRDRICQIWLLIRRNPLFAIAVAAQIFILIYLTAAWQFRTTPLTLVPGDGLNTYGNTSIIGEDGLHLCEQGQTFAGDFATTRWLALRAGQWRFTATYASDDATIGHMRVYSNLSLSNGEVELPAGGGSVSLNVWIPQRLDDFQIRFSGDGSDLTLLSLTAEPVSNTDYLLTLLFTFLLIDFVWLLFARRLPFRPQTAAGIVVLGAVTLFASAPALVPHLNMADDLMYHLLRIEAMADAWQSGQIPALVEPLWFDGQGYASGVFYCDLFLALPALLRLLGFPLQTAYQIYLVAVNLATAAVTWWCVRRVTGSSTAAILGSALYTLAPYRLIDLYRRAAVGEFTAMVFFPLIFAGLWAIFTMEPQDVRYRRCWIPAAIGFAGVLQCHLLSAEMAGLFTLLVCLVFIKRTLRPRTFWTLLKTAATAVLASLWYLIPLADYMLRGGFVITSQTSYQDIQNAGSFLGQLAFILWPGSGGGKNVGEGTAYDMLQGPGAALLLVLLVFVVLHLLNRADNCEGRLGRSCVLLGGLALVLCLWTTPWNLLRIWLPSLSRLLSTIQFPWRYLGFACLFLAIAGASVWMLLRRQNRTLALAFLCLVAALSALEGGYTLSSFSYEGQVLHICDADALDLYRTGNGEYLPDVLTFETVYALPADVQPEDGVTIKSFVSQKGQATVSASAPEGGRVTVPLLAYPYVSASTDDGISLPVSISDQGQLVVTLPVGFNGTFTAGFSTPPLWRGAELFSLIFVAFVLWRLWPRRQQIPASVR